MYIRAASPRQAALDALRSGPIAMSRAGEENPATGPLVLDDGRSRSQSPRDTPERSPCERQRGLRAKPQRLQGDGRGGCQPPATGGQSRHHPQPDSGIFVDAARVDRSDLAKARQVYLAHFEDYRRERRELIRISEIPVD